MKDGIVIIGAGHAGVQAAASLREEGYAGKLTLVSEENELPYHKPPLSKAFLKDADARPQVLRADIFYANEKIDLRFGERVEAIDVAAHTLRFADGGTLGWSRLVLATGSRARCLPVPGSDLQGVYSLRVVADARALRAHAATVENVVILGGGFIGLEIAATLAASGRKVTVIEAQERLLGRAVGSVVANHVAVRLAAAGIRLSLKETVERLEGESGKVKAVVTAQGESIAADMVVVGVGAVPNTELAEAAGLSVSNGIRVDRQMRASAPDVFAIGDVVNFHHLRSAADMRLESVQNATDQARLVARVIMGGDDAFDAVPWFWSDIGDMKLQMVGLIAGGDDAVAVGHPVENRFSVFHYKAGKLIAIESVNRPADHMLGRRMLADGFSPTPEQAARADLKDIHAEWRRAAAEQALA